MFPSNPYPGSRGAQIRPVAKPDPQAVGLVLLSFTWFSRSRLGTPAR